MLAESNMQRWQAGLRFLFQSACPLCDRSTPDRLCQDCTRQLQAYQYQNPRQDWQGDLPLFAWGRYEGALKRAISVLKYNQEAEIGRLLGAWLGDLWMLQPPIPRLKTQIIVVPVPLHCDREKQRGYNQANVMAQGFCWRTGLPLNPALVVRNRATEAQFRLSAQQRQANLNHAFSVQPFKRPALKPTAVLILDDIYTTGATARSLAVTLKEAGLEIVGIAAIAKTENFRSPESS
jgi:ComF family protein